MTAVEQRLRDALLEEADALDESEDLFARVALSIDDDRRLRRQRRRRLGVIGYELSSGLRQLPLASCAMTRTCAV